MPPLLSIRDLCVGFTQEQQFVRVVNHVDLDIYPGETLGLVGESGCGKSVTAMSILRLLPSPPGRIESGSIQFKDQDLLQTPIRALRKIRGQDIGMIFQEPMTALSPLHRIGRQFVETQQFHANISRKEAWQNGIEWMKKVGMPAAEKRMQAFPHELSGGMRQRAMIAMALMMKPALIIADEPTTALDVTIQAQILDLIRDAVQETTATLLITHDMGVIWEMCDRVVVMYASEIVETGPTREIFTNPAHPYTEALLASIPTLEGRPGRLPSIKGQVPSPRQYPTGCHFQNRCPYVIDSCRNRHPELDSIEEKRSARCLLARERVTKQQVQRTTDG